MRISDWSSDVCSSDLEVERAAVLVAEAFEQRDRAVLLGGDGPRHRGLGLRQLSVRRRCASERGGEEGGEQRQFHGASTFIVRTVAPAWTKATGAFVPRPMPGRKLTPGRRLPAAGPLWLEDRKSTRLNSS